MLYLTVANSIHKLHVYHVAILILDEMETTMGNLVSNLMDSAEALVAFDTLHTLTCGSTMTLCMDATMARETHKVLTRLLDSTIKVRLCPRRTEQQTLAVCTVSSPIFPKDTENTDPEDFFNILCAVAASPSNKTVVCVGSLQTAYSVRALLRHNTNRWVTLV